MSSPYLRLVSFAIASLMGLALVLSSCQNQDRVQSYSNDGYLGMTSVNPNLPTNPSHYNYREDARLVRQAVSDIPGVALQSVGFNNATVHVRLLAPNGSTGDSLERIRTTAMERLKAELPRYNVNVNVTAK